MILGHACADPFQLVALSIPLDKVLSILSLLEQDWLSKSSMGWLCFPGWLGFGQPP